jgi:hypothetical protein
MRDREEQPAMMRYALVSLLFALSGCALDAADEPEWSEVDPDQPGDADELMLDPDLAAQGAMEPAEAIEGPEAEGYCVYMNTGTWGCYGDGWRNDRCRTRGDSDYGWRDHCVKRPSHWETVCVCCTL